jgi:pyrroloquinoline quinone (PQQ) biosynthesis protein C
MNKFIEQLKKEIAPVREQLVVHPLYANMQNLQQLQHFTQWHVFAVWDFMSLLKSLQQQLTCTTTPWLPKGNANTRYLINEIVLGEESDVNAAGVRMSHFELYLHAMKTMNADTTQIEQLITYLQNGVSVTEALQKLNIHPAIQQFVNFTFHIINNTPIHVQAAVFTFGREDLIPEMFLGMVNKLSLLHGNKLAPFKYYLERHIEVDGEHHSHLAMEMVTTLCENDNEKWAQATDAAYQALTQRKLLWDAILTNNLALEKA